MDRLRVLYVGADSDGVERWARRLESYGFDPVTAAGVQAGKHHLEMHSIDCVLCGPELFDDGCLEFLRWARDEHPGLPFIVAGPGTDTARERALSAGATDFVWESDLKDSFELLVQRIERAVHSGETAPGPTSTGDASAGREPDESSGEELLAFVRQALGDTDTADKTAEETTDGPADTSGRRGGTDDSDRHHGRAAFDWTPVGSETVEFDWTPVGSEPAEFDWTSTDNGDTSGTDGTAASEEGILEQLFGDNGLGSGSSDTDQPTSAELENGQGTQADTSSEADGGQVLPTTEQDGTGEPETEAKDSDLEDSPTDDLEREGNQTELGGVSREELADLPQEELLQRLGELLEDDDTTDSRAENRTVSGMDTDRETDHPETEESPPERESHSEGDRDSESSPRETKVADTGEQSADGSPDPAAALPSGPLADQEPTDITDQEPTDITDQEPTDITDQHQTDAFAGLEADIDVTATEGTEDESNEGGIEDSNGEYGESAWETESDGDDDDPDEQSTGWADPDGTGADNYERPDDLDLSTGTCVLVQCGSQDDRSEAACTDLLGGAEETDRKVLLIRYKQMDEGRLEHIATHAAETKIITIGYTQPVPQSVRDDVENVKINNPNDVTRLGIMVTGMMDDWESTPGRVVVCYNPLDILLRYKTMESAFRFVHVFLNKLQSAGAISHFHVDPSAGDPQEINTLKPLFDAVVNIDSMGTHIERY